MRKISIPNQKTDEQLQKAIEILSETIRNMNAEIRKIEITDIENVATIFYEFNK